MFKLAKKENSVYNFVVKYDSQEWSKFIEQAYEATKAKYAVQGFRKGKVPRKVIEQNYGANIFFEDAFQNAIQTAYVEILEKHKEIEPVSYPEIDVKKIDENGIEVEVAITTIPEVKLGAYTGLSIEGAKGELDEDKVNTEIEQARNRSARFVPVEREARNGDIVTIDFIGRVDGVAFAGGTAEDHRLELGSKTFVDNFEEQVVGMNIGEKRIVKVTFPENYTVELAGKQADFEVTLNNVEEKQLPELNDEFASNVSEFETLAEYKEDIRKNLQASLEAELARKTEDILIAEVVKNAEVAIPDAMVQQQLDAYLQDFQNRLAYQGLTLEQYFEMFGSSEADFRKDKEDVARENVKTRLVLQEIIKAENLLATEEEVNAKLEEIANKYKKSLDDYKKSMGEKELSYFENGIIMNKLIAFLKEKNNIV